MNKTVLNVEADEILYRSAFAVQRTAWKFISKSGNTRDLGSKFTKTKIIKFMKECNKILDEDYKLEKYIIAEPFSHCARIIRDTIKRLETHGDVRLFLTSSDKSNFRFNVAKTPGQKGQGYKAGRAEKPVHYKAARELLLNEFNAEEIHGYEADDALGIYQNNNTIAVHIDKDINMIPGKHLDWVNMEFYDCQFNLGTVTYNKEKKKAVGRGRKWFYHQLLTGDATDNIPGVPGFGDKTAYTALEGIDNEKECAIMVLSLYQKHFDYEALDRLYEIASLIWICQDRENIGSDILQEILEC